jgi:hypothetical protein
VGGVGTSVRRLEVHGIDDDLLQSGETRILIGRSRAEGSMISSGNWTDSGDERTLCWTVQGSCSSCGQAATIRYTIASAPYEREVRLEMRNIAVPEICP